ncbi:MAG: hypothetical protein IJ123_01340 [Blautia sp.]|nr:hypothetical protein [Blautia sp.]
MILKDLRRAGVTIYAAMIFGVMMALIAACFTSARMAAARAQIVNGAETALFSLFGRFDRQLLSDYGIFGLNCGGTEGRADLAAVCRTSEYYMKGVLNQNSQHLQLKKTGLTGFRLLTDDGGQPFFRQAVLYEREAGKDSELLHRLSALKGAGGKTAELQNIADAEEALEWFTRYNDAIEEAEMLSRQDDTAEEDLLTSEEDILTGGDPVYEFTSVDSPVPVIQSIHDNGYLIYLLSGDYTLQEAEDTAPGLSERTLTRGMEMYDGTESDHSEASQVLFQRYICRMFGSFMRPGDGLPAFQMEYILEGNKNDRENLEKVIERIFRMRVGAALKIIDDNAEFSQSVESLAERICGAFRVPPDEYVIKGALRYCWAYGEGLCEVSSLLAGGNVPVYGNNDLIVPLEGLYVLPEYMNSTTGMADENAPAGSYEDYLSIFMLQQPEEEKLLRTMECIEKSIRSKGRRSFCLDHCITAAEITAIVRVNGRKTFTVTKAYYY